MLAVMNKNIVGFLTHSVYTFQIYREVDDLDWPWTDKTCMLSQLTKRYFAGTQRSAHSSSTDLLVSCSSQTLFSEIIERSMIITNMSAWTQFNAQQTWYISHKKSQRRFVTFDQQLFISCFSYIYYCIRIVYFVVLLTTLRWNKDYQNQTRVEISQR